MHRAVAGRTLEIGIRNTMTAMAPSSNGAGAPASLTADTLPHALIIAGPTASGKSALALEIAERIGGTIINTDSMQVYRELRS